MFLVFVVRIFIGSVIEKKKNILSNSIVQMGRIISFYNFYWKERFQIPYLVVRETDLHSIKYQLVNRYIPCCANLSLWGKGNCSNCVDCNGVANIDHCFVNCHDNLMLWAKLYIFLERHMM